MKFVLILVLCAVLGANAVTPLWEYAVTTKSKIIFFDDKWTQITSAAHQFVEPSAIAFDESQEEIYFNDQLHNNGSVFSLKLSRNDDENHMTEKILSRTQDESIAGMTFDPVDRILYWTDTHNRKIFKLTVDDFRAQPAVLIDFSEGDEKPDGIAIDICRRKLYWSNSNYKNPSITRSSLTGLDRQTLVNNTNDPDLFIPHGIVVDQYSHRIYWVDDQSGSHYSIAGSNFDGSDRRIVVKGMYTNPLGLAVTKDFIFWTDVTTSNAIWRISKSTNGTEKPTKVKSFSDQPRGIIARIGLFTNLENNVLCKDHVEKIKADLLSPKSLNRTLDKEAKRKRQEYCLNNGDYSTVSGTCICKVGFTGMRCEIPDCHNFCVHGTCKMDEITNFATCTCQEGFYGERCESSKCTNYCLNNGHCKFSGDGMPVCECPDSHSGARCEINTTEICILYCKYGRNNTEWNAPPDCPETCDEEAMANYRPRKFAAPQTETTPYTMCSEKYNLTWILTIFGVLIALTLTLFIIKSIRRIYKPARPRIKKTFVVQKKISQTPLTSRPVATEQCEITIENCCNMNICDTPCFDPKLLQQNISCDSGKDDKKILINHMEDDLY